MSLDIGWAAMNLNMTPRIPRIEFDAEIHWDLVKEVVEYNIATGVHGLFIEPFTDLKHIVDHYGKTHVII